MPGGLDSSTGNPHRPIFSCDLNDAVGAAEVTDRLLQEGLELVGQESDHWAFGILAVTYGHDTAGALLWAINRLVVGKVVLDPSRLDDAPEDHSVTTREHQS